MHRNIYIYMVLTLIVVPMRVAVVPPAAARCRPRARRLSALASWAHGLCWPHGLHGKIIWGPQAYGTIIWVPQGPFSFKRRPRESDAKKKLNFSKFVVTLVTTMHDQESAGDINSSKRSAK